MGFLFLFSAAHFFCCGMLGPASNFAPGVGVDCRNVPLAESTNDRRVPAKGDLETTKFISGLRLLGPPGSAVALLSVNEEVSSAPCVTRASGSLC